MFRYFHLKNLPELFTNYFLTNKEIHNHKKFVIATQKEQ